MPRETALLFLSSYLLYNFSFQFKIIKNPLITSGFQLVDKVDKLFYYEGKTREKWRKGTMLRPHQED
ncbi:hypothetical protein, partial [Geobacillus sp. 47C-IIb]